MDNIPQKLGYAFLLAYPVIACVLSLLITKYTIPLLAKAGFLASTGDRHIHKQTTPTAGGIAMIIAFILTLGLAFVSERIGIGIVDFSQNYKFLIPLVVLLIPTGIIDDRFGIRARYKLVLQIIVALLCWVLGIRFCLKFCNSSFELIELALTVFWIVGFINAFNLIDGMDGLAAGITMIASTCMAIVLFLNGDVGNAVIMMCLGAVCLGFLRYNFYPAKVFMGDTGSMFLGYMFATVSLMSSTKAASFSSLMIPLLAGGLPLIDTFLSIWRRVTFKMLSGAENGVMSADRKHLHHRILESHNNNQASTAKIMYFVALILGLAGIAVALLDNRVPGIALVLVLFCFLVVVRRFAFIELRNSTQLLFQGFKQPKKTILICMILPLYDLAVLFIGSVLTAWLLGIDYREEMFSIIMGNILPIMVFLAISRNYRILWLRAYFDEIFHLAGILVLAFMFVFLLNYAVTTNIVLHAFALKYILFFLLTFVAIIASRIFLLQLQSLMVKHFRHSRLNKSCTPVVLYGGGFNSLLYTLMNYSRLDGQQEKLVGIIDDDKALTGLYIYGIKVCGSIENLESIFQRVGFCKIVVTTANISDEKLTRLECFCKKHKIALESLAVRREPRIDPTTM